MAGQAAAHAAVGGLDEAIKEYLLYRGFTQSLKWFEQERKDDKDKGFRVRGGLKLLANRLLGWGTPYQTLHLYWKILHHRGGQVFNSIQRLLKFTRKHRVLSNPLVFSKHCTLVNCFS